MKRNPFLWLQQRVERHPVIAVIVVGLFLVLFGLMLFGPSVAAKSVTALTG